MRGKIAKNIWNLASVCLLLFLAVMVTNQQTIATNGTNIKILILYFDVSFAYRYASKLAAYGEIETKEVKVVAAYSLDYLKQFDLFITFSDYNPKEADSWKDYPKLIGDLLRLIEEGRSLLAIYIYDLYCPADSWVSSKEIECEFSEVELEILPSEITEGVRSLK
ncbi:MAG: hypothetical protein QW782_01215 [Candidatus Bathyarchaeia archaeon]